MIIKFRPDVRFLNQSENLLHLIQQRTERFFEIPDDLRMDFSKFSIGVKTDSLEKEVIDKLKASKFFEVIDEPVYAPPKGLSFLNFFSNSGEEIKEIVKGIGETTFEFLDLLESCNTYRFEEIEKFAKIVKYSSVKDCLASIDSSGENKLLVVLTDSYQRGELVELNSVLLKNRKSWLLVCQDVLGISIGPYFDFASKDHCFSCFMTRIRSNEEKDRLELRNQIKFKKADLDCIGFRLERLWLEKEILKEQPFMSGFRKTIICFDSMGNKIESLNYLPYPICKECS